MTWPALPLTWALNFRHELLRFSGQQVGQVTLLKQEHPGNYH